MRSPVSLCMNVTFNKKHERIHISHHSSDNIQHLKRRSTYGNCTPDASTFRISSIKYCWLFVLTSSLSLSNECDIFTFISSTAAVYSFRALLPTYKISKTTETVLQYSWTKIASLKKKVISITWAKCRILWN